MIRVATLDDAPGIVRLLAETWQAMPYSDQQLDATLLAIEVVRHIHDPDRSVWVSGKDGIGGVLMAEPDGDIASESAFVCRTGEGAGLLRRFMRWATENDFNSAKVSVSSGSKRAGALLEKLGFEGHMNTYTKRIK